jgi:hypothetical protein
VLLCDPADRDLTAGRDPERVSEHPLGFEDALGVVAQRTVAKVAVVFLGLVEPAALMDGEVVAYLPSPFALTTHSVVVGVCHLASPPLERSATWQAHARKSAALMFDLARLQRKQAGTTFSGV